MKCLRTIAKLERTFNDCYYKFKGKKNLFSFSIDTEKQCYMKTAENYLNRCRCLVQCSNKTNFSTYNQHSVKFDSVVIIRLIFRSVFKVAVGYVVNLFTTVKRINQS